MRPWEEKNTEPPVFRGTLPKESEGPCRRCGKWAVLGAGFCVDCWDGKFYADGNWQQKRRVDRQRQVMELAQQGLGAAMIANCLQVSCITVKRDLRELT